MDQHRSGEAGIVQVVEVACTLEVLKTAKIIHYSQF